MTYESDVIKGDAYDVIRPDDVANLAENLSLIKGNKMRNMNSYWNRLLRLPISLQENLAMILMISVMRMTMM